MAKKETKKEEKVEDNQHPSCPNCDTKKKMSPRQYEVDRDGRVIADVFACSDCQAWIRVPRIESRKDEAERLRRRLAELE